MLDSIDEYLINILIFCSALYDRSLNHVNKLKKYITDAWSFSLLNAWVESTVTMLAACHKYPFSIWIGVLSLPYYPFCLPAK